MKQITKFVAFDGVEFTTESACRSHESDNAHKLLIGLTAEQIDAAIAGEQEDIAEALETVGAKIARDRRARGELKRKRAPKDAPATEPEPVHHPMVEALKPADADTTSDQQPTEDALA